MDHIASLSRVLTRRHQPSVNSSLAVGLLSVPAQRTRATRIQQGLDARSIAELEILHVCTNLDHDTGTLVARGSHAKGRHGRRAQVALHNMYVGGTEPREIQLEEDIIGT